MSKVLLFAAVLAAVWLSTWRPLRRVRTVLGLDHLLDTGHAFVLLGYVVGFAFPRPTPLLSDLRPIAAFAGGWVGFSTGMRFDWGVLRTLRARAYLVALLPALGAAGATFGASLGLLHWLGGEATEGMAASMVLAAAAATSAPSLVAATGKRRVGRQSVARPVMRMIELSAGLDDAVVVLLALLAFAFFAPDRNGPATLIFALAAGGGVLLGGVMWLLLRAPADRGERLLLGLAMLGFSAGFAGWLNQSPASVTALAAATLVNLSRERTAAFFEVVARVERLAVVILSTLAGFHITGQPGLAGAVLIAVLVGLRLGAKVAAGALVTGPIASVPPVIAARGWTLGLVPQGTLGLMIALSFFHVWRDELARQVLAAVAIGGLLNEILAPWLLLVLLRDLRRRTGAGRRLEQRS